MPFFHVFFVLFWCTLLSENLADRPHPGGARHVARRGLQQGRLGPEPHHFVASKPDADFAPAQKIAEIEVGARSGNSRDHSNSNKNSSSSKNRLGKLSSQNEDDDNNEFNDIQSASTSASASVGEVNKKEFNDVKSASDLASASNGVGTSLPSAAAPASNGGGSSLFQDRQQLGRQGSQDLHHHWLDRVAEDKRVFVVGPLLSVLIIGALHLVSLWLTTDVVAGQDGNCEALLHDGPVESGLGGIFLLTSYRFFTGFLGATWAPFLIAREGANLGDSQAFFIGSCKLIYGLSICLNPFLGFLNDRLAKTTTWCGRSAFLLAGATICTVGICICKHSRDTSNFWGYLLGASVWMLGEAMADTTTECVVPELLPTHQFDLASSIRSLNFLTGCLVGLGSLIVFKDVENYTWLYVAYMLVMYICAGATILLIQARLRAGAMRSQVDDPDAPSSWSDMLSCYVKPLRYEGGFPGACLCLLIFSFGIAPMFFPLLIVRDLCGIDDNTEQLDFSARSSMLFTVCAALGSIAINFLKQDASPSHQDQPEQQQQQDQERERQRLKEHEAETSAQERAKLQSELEGSDANKGNDSSSKGKTNSNGNRSRSDSDSNNNNNDDDDNADLLSQPTAISRTAPEERKRAGAGAKEEEEEEEEDKDKVQEKHKDDKNEDRARTQLQQQQQQRQQQQQQQQEEQQQLQLQQQQPQQPQQQHASVALAPQPQEEKMDKSVLIVGMILFGLVSAATPLIKLSDDLKTRKIISATISGLMGASFGAVYARFQSCLWQTLPPDADLANAMGFASVPKVCGCGIGSFVAGLLLDLYRVPKDPLQHVSVGGYWAISLLCTASSVLSAILLLRLKIG